MKKNYPKVSYEVIEKACEGDTEAIQEVVNNYSGYIGQLSLRPMKDNSKNEVLVVDETLKGRMKTRLIISILSFDIDYSA